MVYNQADLLDPNSYLNFFIQDILEDILNFLINNASSYYPTNINDINEANWNELIGSNLKASLFLSKEASPFLKKSNGSILILLMRI